MNAVTNHHDFILNPIPWLHQLMMVDVDKYIIIWAKPTDLIAFVTIVDVNFWVCSYTQPWPCIKLWIMNGQQEHKLWYLMLYTEQPPFSHKNTTDSKLLWFRKQEDRNDKFFTHWTRDQDQHIIEPQKSEKKEGSCAHPILSVPLSKISILSGLDCTQLDWSKNIHYNRHPNSLVESCDLVTWRDGVFSWDEDQH